MSSFSSINFVSQYHAQDGGREGHNHFELGEGSNASAQSTDRMEDINSPPFNVLSSYDDFQMTSDVPWQQLDLAMLDAHLLSSETTPALPYLDDQSAGASNPSPQIDINYSQAWSDTPMHTDLRHRRPQLSLLTPGSPLHANMAPDGSLGPHSAPAIRIDGPDSLPVPGMEMVQQTIGPMQGRRRSHSTPRMMLEQHGRHATAPETKLRQEDDFLSPDMAQWVMRDAYLPGDRMSRSGFLETRPVLTMCQTAPSSPVSDTLSNGEGEYMCEHSGCEKTFKSRTQLTHHRRYHTPEKLRRFPCDVCGMRFLFQREVKRHRNSHLATSQRPFKCPICDYRASRSDHLKRHMKKHNRADSAVSPVSSCGSESVTTPLSARLAEAAGVARDSQHDAVQSAPLDHRKNSDFTDALLPDFASQMLDDDDWQTMSILSAPPSPSSAAWDYPFDAA